MTKLVTAHISHINEALINLHIHGYTIIGYTCSFSSRPWLICLEKSLW